MENILNTIIMFAQVLLQLIISVLICVLVIQFILYFNKNEIERYKKSVLRVNRTFREKVDQLNTLWSTNPGAEYEKCMVFLHSFDTITSASCKGSWKGYCDGSTNMPWCPKASASLMNFFLHLPLRVPVESVSFSAFNKHILPSEGEIIFNGNEACGLGFDFWDAGEDREISPMCFYPTDGATLIRRNGGCGDIGFQTNSIKFDKKGYKLNKSGESSSKIPKMTEKAFRHSSYFSILQQDSLNFRQFVEISRKHTSVTKNRLWPLPVNSLNEVVFKSWNGADFGLVPLTCFFHMKQCSADTKEKIHVVSDDFEKHVGYRLPVVSFDPYGPVAFEISERRKSVD